MAVFLLNVAALIPNVYGKTWVWSYTWEQGRQLARMTAATGAVWNFTYDANGMRTGRTGSGGSYTYIYNDSQLSRMNSSGGDLTFTYGADSKPLSLKYNGATYYYVTNLQGDVIAILDSSGTMVVEYTYDAWGKLLSTTGSMASTLGLHNPLRYRGYVYDRETGLYYLQSRYYNPEWGRFINADSIEYLGTGSNLTSYNLFAYCGNNPVMGYDPTGTWDWGTFWDVVVTIGAGLIAFGTGITVTTTTGSFPLGIAAGVATFGTLNNATNLVYYSLISDGNTSIEGNAEKSSYVDGYVSRWERLGYTKKQTREKWYSPNAWRFHSEYSLHMYGWYAIGWAEGKDIPGISVWARRFERAEVDPDSPDSRLVVAVCSVLWGLVGL